MNTTHDSQPSNGNFDRTDVFAALETMLTDERLQEYTSEHGPLQISKISPEIATSEKFAQFCNVYGWPSQFEDGNITPPPQFTDEEFGAALHQPIEKDGSTHHLNNFHEWVWQAAGEAQEGTVYYREIYGSHPARLRAQVVAGEFMDTLKNAYDQLPRSVRRPTPEALASDDGKVVVRGMNVAYQLCGRLLKTNDVETHMKQLFGDSSEAKLITDAEDALSV